MTLAYLAIVGTDWPPEKLKAGGSDSVLPCADMPLRIASEAFTLFAPSETPTLCLPNGGVIVGDLYSRNGTVIRTVDQLARTSSATELRNRILKDCWGDYLLLLPETDNPRAISIMRSPSCTCDLQCVYKLVAGTGFLTSHITLAERLGLYRRRVDFKYIAHRLTYPDLKTSRTGLADLQELLPGCAIHLRKNSMHVDLDWNPWDFVTPGIRCSDPHEAASSIREAIQNVVGAWTADNDSILLELSGGLDSSIVGACLKESRARISCLTLTTPVPGASEAEYANLISGMLGVELQNVMLHYDDAPYRFPLPPDLVTPAIGPLQLAIDRTMQATAARSCANSYFSGGGGDSIFGYLTNAAPAADAFLSKGLMTGIRTIRDISLFHQCTYWKASRLTLRKLLRPEDELPRTDRTFLPSLAPSPEPELHPWLSAPMKSLPGDRQRIFELSATQFFRDSCPRALTRRMRMPLLSQPVVEACLKVPSWMWFHGGQNRAIARLAFSHTLPSNILTRKSKGTFTAYLGALYRRNLTGMLEFLVDGELASHGLLDIDKLLELSGKQMPRGDNAFMRIFQLCTLENWIRQQSQQDGPVSTARDH